MTLHLLTAADFTAFIGKPLTLIGAGFPITAALTEITEHPRSTASAAARTAFSLFFLLRQDEFPHVQSGHYTIDGADLGTIGPVYIERILSLQPGIVRLEAAFN